jgi:hypothetical protein
MLYNYPSPIMTNVQLGYGRQKDVHHTDIDETQYFAHNRKLWHQKNGPQSTGCLLPWSTTSFQVNTTPYLHVNVPRLSFR